MVSICQRSDRRCKPLCVCVQELAHGLGELLSYEGNVEEDFYLTFQVWDPGPAASYHLQLLAYT